jgi:hypothetical protein
VAALILGLPEREGSPFERPHKSREFRQKDLMERYAVEHDVVQGQVEAVFLLGHAEHLGPDQRTHGQIERPLHIGGRNAHHFGIASLGTPVGAINRVHGPAADGGKRAAPDLMPAEHFLKRALQSEAVEPSANAKPAAGQALTESTRRVREPE